MMKKMMTLNSINFTKENFARGSPFCIVIRPFL